ncbi:MAG: RNA polymerase sigma factor [Deltaproteobacteria bacterium]|nr:RNA polymerase sigma factor [Deltaproteobacteria bacterium]
MLRFQRGDVSAFSELVQRHKQPLYNFLLRQLRTRSAAEDGLQDVFLRVVQSASEFKHEARFTTWVYTIARNMCIDQLRKMSLRNHDSLDRPVGEDGPSLGEQTSDGHSRASVERTATSDELRVRITQAVEALPEEQREVFLLREAANLPFKEIAEITSTPENTVKSRMRYALDRLQEALNEYEDVARSLR